MKKKVSTSTDSYAFLMDSCNSVGHGHTVQLSSADMEIIATSGLGNTELPDGELWNDSLGRPCHGWDCVSYPVHVETGCDPMIICYNNDELLNALTQLFDLG